MTDHVGDDELSADPRARPWGRSLASESRRSVLSAGFATLTTFVIMMVLVLAVPSTQAVAPVLGCVIAWATIATTHSILS